MQFHISLNAYLAGKLQQALVDQFQVTCDHHHHPKSREAETHTHRARHSWAPSSLARMELLGEVEKDRLLVTAFCPLVYLSSDCPCPQGICLPPPPPGAVPCITDVAPSVLR